VAAALGVRAAVKALKGFAGPAIADVAAADSAPLRMKRMRSWGRPAMCGNALWRGRQGRRTLTDLDALAEVMQQEIEEQRWMPPRPCVMVRRGLSVWRWSRKLLKGKNDVRRLGAAVALAGIALVALPRRGACLDTGRIFSSASRCSPNLHQLPNIVADLLRAFPYDFLYGNIAADTSMAKKYAPVGRHCHAWHVGQEIFDLARAIRCSAFGLGYLSHLAATPSPTNFSCRASWADVEHRGAGSLLLEIRFETHLGDAYAREARDVIMKDHGASDAHLDEIISPRCSVFRTIAGCSAAWCISRDQSWQWGLPGDRGDEPLGSGR